VALLQLTPEQKAISGFFPGFFDTRGWGFGVGIVTGPDDVSPMPGRYGWDGLPRRGGPRQRFLEDGQAMVD